VKEPITYDEAKMHRQTFIREEYPQNKKVLCGIVLWLSIFVSIVCAIYLTIYPGSRLLLWYPVIILGMVSAGYYDAYRSMSAYKKFKELYPEEYKLLSAKSDD
jgi:UDP-N-acetylmuramyl pentapeptide phosphotransferase/UDP-N-acetylglucosamine-1-phosphate transferase